jgi:hypothetical protein
MTEETYYHVASENYHEGDPLFCFNKLQEFDFDVEWKWQEADEGWDTDVVCVFDEIEDAQEFKEEYGGKLLKITVSQEDIDEPINWNTKYGYIWPERIEVIEGYMAFREGVPAEWIEVIE